MRSHVRLRFVVAVLVAGLACEAGPPDASGPQGPPAVPRTALRDPASARGVLHLPVRFEENAGQTGEGVRFLAQAAGYAAWVADDAIGFATAGAGRWTHVLPASLRMTWGAVPGVEARGIDPRPTVVGYAAGAAAENAIEGVRTFGGVEVADVVPGVRLHFGDDGGRVGLGITADSGAALAGLALRFAGLGAPEIDEEGGLVFRGRQGMARVSSPTVRHAQSAAAAEGAFAIDPDGVVRVRVGEDAGPLRVEARIGIWNYLGGTADASLRKGASLPSVAVGSDGRLFVGGDSVEPHPPFGPPGPWAGGRNGFVACLDLGGEAPEVLWVRHLGGPEHDGVSGLAAGSDGRVFAAGWSQSGRAFAELDADAPEWHETMSSANFVLALDGATSEVLAGQVLTLGSLGVFGPRVAFDASAPGAPVIVAGNATVSPAHPDHVMHGTEGVFGAQPFGGGDGYVAGLDADLSAPSWFTYLGGSGGEVVLGVAAEGGRVHVAGSTSSSNFPADVESPVCALPCAPFVATVSGAGTRLDGVRRLGAAPEGLDAPVALATVADGTGGTPVAMFWTLVSASQHIVPLPGTGEASPWDAAVPAGSGPALGVSNGSALAGSASADAIALVAVDGGGSRTLASAAFAGQLADVDVTPAGRVVAAGVQLGEPGPDAPDPPAPVPGDAYFLVEAEGPR